MSEDSPYRHVLIRDATVLVRMSSQYDGEDGHGDLEFFDVRTGAQLREIHPPFRWLDVERGFDIEVEVAAAILSSGAAAWFGPDVDPTKVVSILEVKQRKLDSVVSDSVLDQVRVIRDLLQKILNAAENAPPAKRYWLSQQLLALVGKFSGRELAELDEMTDWFFRKPSK